ncbi:uncharacterized protein LOC126974209 [Leptidea sinapis]|uniref:uncharacterized protein LOC126974209 n=1 Tax=Leptidea sinapis TaxID=189913 RepID=UPI00213A94BE|nr:uncharacterized protein LOC126974209 [Leptidea sinapis]
MYTYMILVVTLFLCQRVSCDWVNDWLTPVQREYKQDRIGIDSNDEKLFYGDGNVKLPNPYPEGNPKYYESKVMFDGISTNTLKLKLETTLQTANDLAETLRQQISKIEKRERVLKDSIVNGRSGVTTLSLTTMGRLPKTYIIRDGFWSICNGLLQHPVSTQSNTNLFSEIFSTPRCIGQEIQSIRDPCAFNSIIKYETIPSRRRSIYQEDDYFCLKSNFNSSLEQYLSVPKRIVNETCNAGTVRSLAENTMECGTRILSDYTYYPRQDVLEDLPLEYCSGSEIAPSCKLIVAWQLSNATIENFDMLYDDQDFKKQFVNSPLIDSAYQNFY